MTCRASKVEILFILIVLISSNTLAFSPLPSQFYGKLIIDGEYAVAGTEVTVYDKDGLICGKFITKNEGEYVISCKGDNPDTRDDEGAKENDAVYFYVNQIKYNPDVRWHEGSFQNVDMHIRRNATETLNETLKTEIPAAVSESKLTLYELAAILSLIIIVFVIVLFTYRNKKLEGI